MSGDEWDFALHHEPDSPWGELGEQIPHQAKSPLYRLVRVGD